MEKMIYSKDAAKFLNLTHQQLLRHITGRPRKLKWFNLNFYYVQAGGFYFTKTAFDEIQQELLRRAVNLSPVEISNQKPLTKTLPIMGG